MGILIDLRENIGMRNSGAPRLWELDFLRGIAIVSMVTLHALVDFSLLGGTPILTTGLRYYWQRVTAILFLVIFGIGAGLSYSKSKLPAKGRFRSWLQKGLILWGWGMVITLTTAIFFKERFVVFGILHLMGISSVLVYPCLSLKYLNLPLGVLIILAGNYLSGYRFRFVWLAWLGLIPEGFCSIDYFPVFPWSGYILIGIFIGFWIYPNGKRRFGLKEYPVNPIIKNLSSLGQKSLLVYLVHQPLLLAFAYTVNRIF